MFLAIYDHPFKEFEEEDDDLDAHRDMTQPKVMTYIASSKDHDFMHKKTLPDNSITYQIFDGQDEETEVNYDTELDDDGKEIHSYLYIDDVVREKQMHYFRIPKLGCYIAVPLVY